MSRHVHEGDGDQVVAQITPDDADSTIALSKLNRRKVFGPRDDRCSGTEATKDQMARCLEAMEAGECAHGSRMFRNPCWREPLRRCTCGAVEEEG